MGSSGGPARDAGPHDEEPQIVVADSRWRRFIRNPEAVVRRAACEAGATCAVVLASDRDVRRLNLRHRGRNKPTNVLAFPPSPGWLGGEIILASGVVQREAVAVGRRPAHYLAHLVVHGCLHLRGHDHHHAGSARRMEQAESRILHRLGVPNPWRAG